MNNLRIKTCVLGQVGTNCYIVYHDQTKAAVIIDPADNSPYVIEQCQKYGLHIEGILLTHGHFDHIMAAADLQREYGCNIYAGKEEAGLLKDPDQNLTKAWGRSGMVVQADVWLADQAAIQLLGMQWQVLFTPGHTAGSVCFYVSAEDVLFSGDTLFEESLGRTDLPTGDSAAIVQSITNTLFTLPADTMVYPGHGNPTTIGHEQQYNPVVVYNRR